MMTQSDASLYKLVLNSEQPPYPLQASSATFKSLVRAALDFLLEQNLPATLWVKLPNRESWQADLDRYLDQASGECTIYICHHAAIDALDSTESVTSKESNSIPTPPIANQELTAPSPQTDLFDENDAILIDDGGTIEKNIPRHATVYSLPLASDSQLKREYFLLMLCPHFGSLILAHSPRSSQPPSSPNQSATLTPPLSESTGLIAEPERKRKQPLLMLCCFEPQTINTVLGGIQQALIYSQSQARERTARSPDEATPTALEILLNNWHQRVQLPSSLDISLIDRFLTRHIQQQEKNWRSAVTYRKQATLSESLQLQNEELLKALRLQDEFLSNVCQELRTPLANMKTALTLINSPNLKSAQRQRYMEVLNTECDRQGSLIAGLLELVQMDRALEETEVHPLPINDIVPGVVSTFQPLAQEKGIMLAYTLPEGLPPVSCLSAWLRQIAINLLDNSIKFTPSGGQVWVRAKQQGDYIQLEFRDSGIGIPAPEIPKIFDRFYRVRHVSRDDIGGAGLGLTIVQQLLLRCGGSISVKSKPGNGSIFNVLLPIDPSIT